MVPGGTVQDFFLNVGDRIFFDENIADLSPTAMATLDKQAAWLKKFQLYRITIEGHSDERGSKPANLALANRRAQAARDYLATRGVEGGRMRVVAYGRDRRVVTCNNLSCWSQNRRAVTVLHDTDSPPPPSAPTTKRRTRPASRG
jgi:peptidoglycan-associated lipoprotein